jgi:DNA-binding NtrC family response regulator
MIQAGPVSILVVDDEPPLRKLMQAFLERMGYLVETRGDARTALELLRAEPDRFALVVADLSLPDKPGDEMSLEMLSMVPTLKILLCSGYPVEVAGLPAPQRANFGTLQKPFLPSMLTEAVEELLRR